jgi:ribose transport system substrate-binding protein
MAGCASYGSDGGDGEDGSDGGGSNSSPQLALSIPTLEFTFYVRMRNAWNAAKVNNRISQDSRFYDAQGDQSTQLGDIETAITNEVDVLIASPVTGEGILPGIDQANDAGIPVIAIDRDYAETSGRETYIGSDNVSLGERSSQLLREFISEASDNSIYNVIQLEGTPGAPNVELRGSGFQSVVDANDDFEVLDSQTGEFTTQGALSTMNDLITRHGDDIDGVFCQNDLMCLGAHQALSDNNMNVPITGVDGTEGWVELFSANEYYGTLAQLPEGMVDQAVKSSKALLNDEEVQDQYEIEGLEVTQDNGSNYLNEYFD